MKKRIQAFMKKHDVHQKDRLLIALSGGPDSTALLLMIQKMGYDVIAAHINHNLRGEESDREETFCRELCMQHGVPLYVKKLSAEELQKGGQDQYRILRYLFLKEVYDLTHSDYLVTGHHQNDQVETVLYNMIKGAGIIGLCGILPKAFVFDMQIIRPFLEISKVDIISYLNEQNQKYQMDSSNLKIDYARNKIRHEVLPKLDEDFSVNTAAALSKTSIMMQEVMEMLEEMREEIGVSCLLYEEGRWSWNMVKLMEYPKAARKHAMMVFLRGTLGIEHAENIHVETIFNLMKSEKNTKIQLPNKIVCHHKGTKFEFYIPSKEWVLNEVVHANGTFQNICHTDVSVCLDPRFENCTVQAVTYEEGSKIYYQSDKRKKIKKLIKEKIEIELKDVWYIKVNEDIVYIPQIDYVDYRYREYVLQRKKIERGDSDGGSKQKRNPL